MKYIDTFIIHNESNAATQYRNIIILIDIGIMMKIVMNVVKNSFNI